MIPFTQYLRPDGRTKQIELRTGDESEGEARRLIERGYRFEAEVLVTGEVSLTVSDGEEDVAIELCENGFIWGALERLVKAAADAVDCEPTAEADAAEAFSRRCAERRAEQERK